MEITVVTLVEEQTSPWKGNLPRILETQAIDDQDHLVNYDNDNENDDLGYQSEEYLDEADKEDENNHSNGNVVKRGITRLYKFRREYGKPDGIKLSVTFDALNRISGKHRALFSSFLGDMVREHIVRKLVMNCLGQLLRNFRRKLRQTYILPNQNTLSKLNEVSAKYSAILKAEEWVNFVKYMATEEYKVKSAAAKMARSKSVYQHTMGRGGYALVKEKMKETEDKIKEGTLKVDHGIDAMTVVLGKEKGGYARGMGSGVTYKRYFDLSRSRQASDERILLLQSQLDNERHERQEKELLIQNLSNKMSQTEGMEKEQLVVDVNDASIQKSNGLATLEKEMETRETVKSVGSKKMTRSIRKDSSRQDSQSQENVSPLLVLPQAIKCKLWHLNKSTIISVGYYTKTDGNKCFITKNSQRLLQSVN
ncbi:hypothetical protein Tco_0576603 [Tanacetum coccineum]